MTHFPRSLLTPHSDHDYGDWRPMDPWSWWSDRIFSWARRPNEGRHGMAIFPRFFSLVPDRHRADAPRGRCGQHMRRAKSQAKRCAPVDHILMLVGLNAYNALPALRTPWPPIERCLDDTFCPGPVTGQSMISRLFPQARIIGILIELGPRMNGALRTLWRRLNADQPVEPEPVDEKITPRRLAPSRHSAGCPCADAAGRGRDHHAGARVSPRFDRSIRF